MSVAQVHDDRCREHAPKVVAVSGGFDPLHAGHLDLLEAASDEGDVLWVFLNSDEFLVRKKGAPFMEYGERARVLESLRVVDAVLPVVDLDDTVCRTLEEHRPDVFCNGGDRHQGNTPEDEVCRRMGIRTVYGVGGGKVQSSSWLIEQARGVGLGGR